MTTITIKARIPFRKRAQSFEVEAEVFGPVAVHRDLFDEGWVITHVKTGWAISGRLVHRRGAIALAKKCQERADLFENLSTTNPNKNKYAGAYLKECRAKIKSSREEYIL